MKEYNFEGKRILIVEDNKLNIEIVSVILSMAKITCDTATNGEEAIQQFIHSEEGYYSAILSDIQMPVMDGNNMVKSIRQLKRKDANSIPIIAMTASDEEEQPITCIHSGFNEQIAKPVKPEFLFHILEKYLQKNSPVDTHT